jgi:hypothetical protein
MQIAKKIRDVQLKTKYLNQALYKLSNPLKGYKYVLASTLLVEPVETLLFGCTDKGDLVEWLDVNNSTTAILDHYMAFQDIGYEVLTDEMLN